MKKFLWLLPLLLVGCATTDKSIVKAGQMQQAALLVIQDNQTKAINAMLEDEKKLLNAGYRQALLAGEKTLVDFEGKVDLAQYKAYVQDLADDLNAKEAVVINKAGQINATMNAQISAAIALGSAVQRYNEATGITDETFKNLIDSSDALIRGGIDAYSSVAARHATEAEAAATAKAQKQQVQTGGLIEFMKKVQASQQTGGTPLTPDDFQALVNALRGITPPTPPAPPTTGGK